jgi:hypothetical protein
MRNAFIVSILAALLPWNAAAGDYQLGQGLAVGDRFFLSGYANVVVDAPQNGASAFVLDDLSLFVTGRINQWLNPFLEAEVSGLTLARQGDGPRSSGHFVPERFYDDALLTASDTLRIGKMLAPVGDWNLIHAAPLVPTVTRPLTTQRGFSEYASGASWLHENAFGGRAAWQLYWQPGNDWYRRPEAIAPRSYKDVLGAHFNWSLGFDDKVGLSYQRGRLAQTGETYDLIGANVRKTFGALSLEAEAIRSQWHGELGPAHDDEWGCYALADYAFAGRWHAILEGERFQDHRLDVQSRNTLIGVAYRPQAAVAWKLEHVRQTGDSQDIPTGWFASFSVMF